MTSARRSARRRLAWTVPVATAAVVAGAVAVPMAASAGSPDLETTTPEALLAAVAASDVTHLSGQVEQTARLGLPSLPGADDATAMDWQTLVTGTHTASIAIDGPNRQRLALLGTLAESDVVHNGSDVWAYSSETHEVSHVVLPAGTQMPAPGPHDLMNATPQGAAQQMLDAVTPTTGVSIAENTRVAGQDAYTLVLTPGQESSTISRVEIAVDAARYLPLRVQIFGVDDPQGDPVFESGFAAIDYDRPSAATFDFAVPEGASVTTRQLPMDAAMASPSWDGVAAEDRPTVHGTGWTSVVEFPAGPDAMAALNPAAGVAADRDSSAALLDGLLVRQANGDRLLETALVNVLVTADGHVFAGAVQPSVLQQAAAATR